MYAKVILQKPVPRFDGLFDYKIPENLLTSTKIGSVVAIPFGKRETIGYVIELTETSDVKNIKEIIGIIGDEPAFSEKSLALAKWISNYYFSFFISALRLVMPPGSIRKSKLESRKKKAAGTEPILQPLIPNPQSLVLTADQQSSSTELNSAIDEKAQKTFLLYGPTNSGKTEVYLRAVSHALEKSLGSIILVPEISLTPQLIDRFKEKFNCPISIIHSGITLSKRNQEWERLSKGESKIVLGTRSAIFAPVKDLGLVVLDEEFEQSYKQDQNPHYHAREVGRQLGATVVLVSASPSIETFYKAEHGEYQLLKLNGRINNSPYPEISVVDMNTSKSSLFSNHLLGELKKTIDEGEKAILFVNRKGFFTTASCSNCGHTLSCPKCLGSLILIQSEKILKCPRCTYSFDANLICPKCHSASIYFSGIGTQRVEKEIQKLVPEARAIRLDQDSDLSPEEILNEFTDGNHNVLIGTQLASKGIDIKNVSMVGVISADGMLNLPDFRSSERTFAQLLQLSGRAGRREKMGSVVIQTRNPDHYVFKFLKNHDYEGFYDEEIEIRKQFSYPPFYSLVNITISSEDRNAAIKTSKELADNLIAAEIKVLGPAKAPIERIRGSFRYQIILKGEKMETISKLLSVALKSLSSLPNVKVDVDVDPASLL